MSEMVERVAKAMMDADDKDRGGHILLPDDLRLEPYRLRARAAIAAMREPTKEMHRAGEVAWSNADTSSLGDSTDPDKVLDPAYRAMIDAALKG